MGKHVDLVYKDLVFKVLKEGVIKGDRTGTGTISSFGNQIEIDLQDGFPLLTTKRVYWKGVVAETIMFLKGITDLKFLLDKDVDIWTRDAYKFYQKHYQFEKIDTLEEFREHVKEKGFNMGNIYGKNWVNFGGKVEIQPQPTPKLREGLTPTYLGVANGAGSWNSPLRKTWEGLIGRCYDKNHAGYNNYGYKGVFVCNEWLEFKKFEEDAVKLIGWEDKIKNKDIRYVLDKDRIGDGFSYSIDNCCWITDAENNPAVDMYTYKLEKDGVIYEFNNVRKFCRELEISDKNICDLWTGNKNAKKRHGFTFVSKTPLKNVGVNQLMNVINDIKVNPDSRRLKIYSANPSIAHTQTLPPCHDAFQFNVREGYLDCIFQMRSNDLFHGNPFNISSYALITHIIAEMTDLNVGKLIAQLGDTHIYSTHLDALEEQMKREPKELPTLKLSERVKQFKDIGEIEFEDIELINYNPHPTIKAPQAF